MKIEKISDNQIKCTLNKSDLASREIKISELAYGTNKAKDLFRDMMKQASYEFGFEADDIPLMIEAIPVSADCIVLIITKVEDPEELDTRFSKFAPVEVDEDGDYDEEDEFQDTVPFAGQTLEAVTDMLKQFSDALKLPLPESTPDSKSSETASARKEVTASSVYCYSFSNLEELITACHYIKEPFEGTSKVFKTFKDNFLLVIESKQDPKTLLKICNVFSEYGQSIAITYPTINFFGEHYEVLIEQNAIEVLGKL